MSLQSIHDFLEWKATFDGVRADVSPEAWAVDVAVNKVVKLACDDRQLEFGGSPQNAAWDAEFWEAIDDLVNAKRAVDAPPF
jgi:hypothetical protein